MAVQITGRQIANGAVDVNKLDLSSGTFDFQEAVLLVATPSADSHAATKGYVDSISQGLHWKDSVKVATTANITLSGTQTIDGVAISADQRVLVKNQSTGSENGIYLCKSGAWERSADMNAAGEFSGAAVFVQEGTANGDTGYVCTNDGNVTVGTTAITFVQFTGAGQLSGGDGIDITGSTISVNVDDSSIEISSDALQVKAAGITNAMLAGSIANAKLANSTISGVSLGANLNSLSAGNGLSMTSYNGSAAVSDLTIDLDGASLAVGASGIKVADAGIDTAQIADSAVTAAKLAGSIPADKLTLGNGVEDNAGSLQVALDGGSLALGVGGLSVAAGGISDTELAADSVVSAKIADGAIDNSAYLADSVVTNAKLAGSIANAKLANSTISGVALGSNLNSLSAGNGLSMTAYNGSAAVSDLTINLDGATLSVSGNGLKVATGGIDTDQLAADAITNAKIADDAIKTDNLDFAGFFAAFDADGSTASFDLAGAVDLEFKEFFVVTVNGLVMEYKDTPDAQDNYKIDNNGTGDVGRILFGSNLSNNDRVTIRGFINN